MTTDADLPADLEARVADKVGRTLIGQLRSWLGPRLRNLNVAIAVLFVCCIGFGTLVTLQARSRNQAVVRIEASTAKATLAAREAQAAAEKASSDLADALRQSRQGNGPDGAAVVAALQAIARIEAHLCGGPCPPAPPP
jgi:hypothetical protein